MVSVVLWVIGCAAPVCRVVDSIPVAPCYVLVSGIFRDNIMDVIVDCCTFGGVIAWHIDTQDVCSVVNGLVCEVASYFSRNLMVNGMRSECLLNKGDDTS